MADLEIHICQACVDGYHVECTAYQDQDPTRNTCECSNPDHVEIEFLDGLRNSAANMLKSSPMPMMDIPEQEFIPTKVRTDVLKTADGLINGDREEIYGPPEINFGVIAALWTAMGFRIQSWKGEVREINATDVALAMAQVKLGRLVTTPNHRDSWVDGIGYLACGAETALPGLPTESYLKGIQVAGPVLFEEFKRATRTKEMIVRCRHDMEQLPFSKIQEHMTEKHPDADKYLAPSS